MTNRSFGPPREISFTGRDDRDAGEQRDERIGEDDDAGVLDEVLFLAEVGAVGDHGAHGQGQGEEHLAAGGAENGDKVRRAFNEAALDRIAGDEHELQALDGVGERQRPDDDDDEHHEQGRHADLVELLDAGVDAAGDDEEADHHEGKQDADGDRDAGDHVDEGRHALRHAAEDTDQVDDDVVDAVAAQDRVEGHDQERREHREPAEPLELLRNSLVGGDRSLSGLAAESQLGAHDDQADEDRQEQIHQQEREAAGLAHLKGEAPDVAETDRGADSSKQEAYVAAP